MPDFSSPPHPAEFNARVWELVRQVPRGRVTTYGRVAELLGIPAGVEAGTYRTHGARWVGGAMAACPADVPWQRVFNSQGKISIRSGGGHLKQLALLEAEGVEFDEKQRVDLARFEWGAEPPPAQARLWD
jgi:methylated-DNA-protein-cysteine methyltransferase-like protein